MDQLTEIFSISQPNERAQKLLALARSLRVNVAKAKNAQGEPDENKLAVLIFEELREGRQKKRQRTMIVILAVILFIFGTIAMYVLSQFVAKIATSQKGSIFDEAE